MKEDYAIVLDFLSTGYADSYKREPIAQVIGEKEFSLLEVNNDTSLAAKEGEPISDRQKQGELSE